MKNDTDFNLEKRNLFQSILNGERTKEPHFLHTLIETLQKSHVVYLNKKLPEIQQSIFLLSNKFTDKHRFFNFLATLFKNYEKSLLSHIEEEEHIIFPYVNYLLSCEGIIDQAQTTKLLRGSQTLQQFIASHSDTEAQLDVFIEMLKKVQNDVKDCYPFNVLIHQITWLRDDLNRHAFYEDEVLVKTALRIETELLHGIQLN